MTNKVQHLSPLSSRWWIRLPPAATALAVGTVLLSAVKAATLQEEEALKPPVYSVLYTFTGGADGANPAAGLVLDEHGNIYGTTVLGGEAGGWCYTGCGVVFKIDRTGKETVLHTFAGADGANPYAPLIRDWRGDLYGTTYAGGTGACTTYYGVAGCGVVFKADMSGNFSVLYNLTGGSDGSAPDAGVVRDHEGNLYGTASTEGDTSGLCGTLIPQGCGTVFELTASGTFKLQNTFTGPDGAIPLNVVRDEEGDLYGVTLYGGTSPATACFGGGDGCGVVFKIDRKTHEKTVLYSFQGGADGGLPYGVIRDREGNLYGTTFLGGNASSPSCGSLGCGVVFKVDREGKETVLYSFTGGADGGEPEAGVIRDEAGNLYGTTQLGGAYGEGVIFKLDPNGKETVLYNFKGPDGEYPEGSLVLDREGNLYGTTYFGGDITSPTCGTLGCGVVFKVKLRCEDDEDCGESSTTTVNPANSVPMDRRSRFQPGPLYRIPGPRADSKN